MGKRESTKLPGHIIIGKAWKCDVLALKITQSHSTTEFGFKLPQKKKHALNESTIIKFTFN